MTIQVRFFASLREQMGLAEKPLTVSVGMTVADAWKEATGLPEIPANTLMAVNMEYVDAGQAIEDGDEIAFFPPVTGG